MKKFLLFVMFLAASTFGVYAVPTQINLSNSHKNNDNGRPARTPIRIPEAFIEDYTLTFDSSCIGCNVTLLQDDIVIFTAIVEENDDMEGEVVLPEFLEGQYEIRLEIGSIIFVGEIDL